MKKKIKENQAITLLALVITIVIIIILATIAINFAFGENGLVTKAQQAAEMTEVAKIQEELEMAKATAAIDGAGNIDPDHYFDIIEDEGVIDDKDSDVENNGDGSYDVTTEGDRIFEVTPTPDGDLEIEYVGKNDEPRISKINVTDKTDTSVTIEVVTKNMDDEQNIEYKYEYKKTGDDAWQQGGTSSENPFTIDGLEENTSYDIKVTIELGDGTTVEKTITVVLGNGSGIPTVPDNAVDIGEIEWQGDGTANLPVSTDEDFTIEYQVVGADGQPGEWKPVEGDKITGVKPGEKVNVKLTDGEHDSNIQTIEIKDEVPPTVKINVTSSTSGSITVSASATDGESGMTGSPTYTYYIKESGTGDENYQTPSGASNITDSTYTFTGLTPGVSYDIKVEVKSDAAGNTGVGTLSGQSTGTIPGGQGALDDGTVTVSEPEWEDGKASITVDTTTDYDIEYKKDGDDDWTKVGEDGKIPDLGYGDEIKIHLTDGENDGEDITVTIEDNVKPKVNVTSAENTSNSVSVSVSVTDEESGMADTVTYTYYIKQTGEPDSSYVAKATNIEQNTYTFTGLTQGVSYDVKVEVKADKAGNMGTGTLLGQTTASIPGGDSSLTDGSIEVSEPEWTRGKASITVTTDTSYNIEYQVGGASEGNWTTVTSGSKIPDLDYGDNVNIRLTDGTNHGDFVTVTIDDGVPPTVDVTLGTSTSNTIVVNVNATDDESGMAGSATYTYYIKESSQGDGSYQTPAGATDISSNTYTFTGLEDGVSYDIKVEVKSDVAGNMGTGTLTNQTTTSIPGGDSALDDGTITVSEPEWEDGKATIEVGTDTGYDIEYQINGDGSSDSEWTPVGEDGKIPDLNPGDKVIIHLTDGGNDGGNVTITIEDDVPPIVTVTPQGTPTSNSIGVSVSAQDNESGMASSLTYTYYIKQNGTGDENYLAPENAKDISQNIYTFTGLQQGTSYDVKVEVKSDVAGNTGSGTLTNQTTQNIPSGSGEGQEQGAITFGTPSWSSGTASITVSTTTNYQIEYKFSNPEEDSGWTHIDNNGTISGLSHGATVYARLTDGTNHGKYATASITDGIAPIVTVTPGGATSNSLSVSVSAVDNESGMASSLTYTYYIKQSTEADTAYVAKASNIAANTYIFSGLTQDTSYDIKVEVTGDMAGNTGTGTLPAQTTATIPGGTEGVQDGSITFSIPSWSGGKASVIVSTNTSYNIEYQIGAVTGSWTPINNNGTISNISNGTTIYARLTDGVNCGDYASITVQDTTPPTVSLSTSATYNSITVTVNASDGESGLATSDTYKYYINNESTPRNTSTSNSYTFTGLSAQTGYSIKVEVTNGVGVVGTGSTSVTTPKKPATNVNEVTDAEYVNYVDKNGETRLCAVLYDSSSSYGVQIITMENVEDSFELGNGTGKTSIELSDMQASISDYNNAITLLNNEANKYLNTTYATSARCVGSVPNNPNYESGYYSGYSYINQCGSIRAGDENYKTDFEQMEKLGINYTGDGYWLASRSENSVTDAASNFGLRYVYWQDGSLSSSVQMWYWSKPEYSTDNTTYRSRSTKQGIRAVFTLKSNIRITGGSGTQSDPYTLGV